MLQEYCDRFFSDLVDPFIEGALKAVEKPINRGKINEISSIIEPLRGGSVYY